jgi:hypothetical protein
VPAPTPPPLVDVKPAQEIRTLSPVNEVAADGGRAATLVGTAQAWEYLLVWSPKGVVIRASLNCQTQESNVVLAGNRFAHVCFQGGENYVVTGTLRPLRARVALRARGFVSLAGAGNVVAGSAQTKLWRFDTRKRVLLHTYAQPAIALDLDGGRILVDRSPRALQVVTSDGRVQARLTLAHDGGAVLHGDRIATIANRRVVLTDLHGRRVLTRSVVRGARIEDFDGKVVVYSVETRLHVLRIVDGRDVALRLRGQFGYARARLSGDGLFYAYNAQRGQTGRAGFVLVRALLRG